MPTAPKIQSSFASDESQDVPFCNDHIEFYEAESQWLASFARVLIAAIDAKDHYTAGHSHRVARASVVLAKRLGIDQETQNTIYLGGLLHDIGKIGIDDYILNKSDKLTNEEYEHMTQHPRLGCEILQGAEQLDQVLPIVLHHHEKWDGSGYPTGLQGVEIPQVARIVTVADALDAMSSDRPYRQGMSEIKIDKVLREGAGLHWDPKIVDAFFAVRDEIGHSTINRPHWLVRSKTAHSGS